MSGPVWKLVRRKGLDLLDCRYGPAGEARFVMSTRRGGVSFGQNDLNLSKGTGDSSEHVEENRRRLFTALETPAEHVATLRQVHSADVVHLHGKQWQGGTEHQAKADGYMALCHDRWLGISVGDCLAIGVFDPDSGALAMVHAGWRGTAARIAATAVHSLTDTYGADPSRLHAIIGPGIGWSVYEVDSPVFEEFSRGWPQWQRWFHDLDGERGFVDLVSANRWLLDSLGLQPDNITALNLCTHTLRALFFSHRRDGLPGGRMYALGSVEQHQQ